MENHSLNQSQVNGALPIGKRNEILDEEAKKRDEEFWKNNPLFGIDQAEPNEGMNLDSPEKEPHQKGSENQSEQNGEEVDNDMEEEDNQEGEENKNLENEQEGDENEGDEEIDDQDEDGDYEQVISSDEIADSADDEEQGKTLSKDPGQEEKPKPPEEEEEDEVFKLFVKNREDHLFFRPVFLKLDLQDCEKSGFSYIKLPQDHLLTQGKNENEISKRCINRSYIGVPPRAPEGYRSPMQYPTIYNNEMFKCEDERYHIDLNIIKYKNILKNLENIAILEDENEKKRRLDSALRASKMLKQKYEIEESQDENQKLINIINELHHDIENLYKKRAHSDIITKKKKELVYPLAVRDCEFRYATYERALLSNTKLVDEMSKNFLNIPLKKVNSPMSEENIDYKSFYNLYKTFFFHNELHQVLFNDEEFGQIFNQHIENLFLTYRTSPYSILPSNLFYISDKEILNRTIQLVLYTIKNSNCYDPKTLTEKLSLLVQNHFGFDLEEKSYTFDIGTESSLKTIEQLTKYEHFNPEAFMTRNVSNNRQTRPDLNNIFTQRDIDINKEFANLSGDTFKLFIPGSGSNNGRSLGVGSYGTHFYYFVMKYIYLIYLKLLLVNRLSSQGNVAINLFQPTIDTFMNLTAAYALDKLDNLRYEVCLVNLFGAKAKYLFNIKSILAQITKALLSLIDDTLSFELLDKILRKKKLNESEEPIFTLTCNCANDTEEDEANENFMYRFHLDRSTGWFLASVFDVKGIFMRVLKTKDKGPISKNPLGSTSPKRIQPKRLIQPSQTAKEKGITDFTEDLEPKPLLGKRKENGPNGAEDYVDDEDPNPVKKVHND